MIEHDLFSCELEIFKNDLTILAALDLSSQDGSLAAAESLEHFALHVAKHMIMCVLFDIWVQSL